MTGFGESHNPKKKSRAKKKTNMSQKKLFAKASKSYSQGNILESARYYKKLLDIGFTDPNIFNNYGSICKQLGQTEQAIRLYRQSIQLYPKFANSHYNLGNALRDQGKL